MNKRLINNILVAVLIIIIFILGYLVIRPILISIIFGLIFSYILHPLNKKLNKSIKNKTLSATIIIICFAFIVIVPLVYFTPIFIEQVFIMFEDIRQVNIADLIITVFPFVEPGSTAYSILLNLNNLPGKMVSGFTDGIFSVIVNLPNLMIQGFVFLFTLFFTLKDADSLRDYFNDLSPFSKPTERRFLREFRGITNSVILGQVAIGVIQGLLVGIALWIVNFDNVLTWTIITTIVSIIPVIGAWLVWVPLSVYLIVLGNNTGSIFLALYGGLFVSNIDNIIRPYFLSKSSKLPLFASLTGTIGGLYFLGIIGLVLGPLIIAYILIILDFYKEGRLDELYKETRYHSIGSYEIKG